MLAVMAELAYALDSGSSPRKWVGVQVPLTASEYPLISMIRGFFMSQSKINLRCKKHSRVFLLYVWLKQIDMVKLCNLIYNYVISLL